MDFAVSGDAIRLAGNAFLVRALQALGELPSSLPDHAIIGGLAVMVRLQQAHRVTGDIDLVSADESRTIQLLADGDATRTRNGVRLPSGIDLDLIDASDPGVTPGIATDEIERRAIEGQLEFSHALRSATLVDIITIVGLIIGIPLGIAFGRIAWRTLADHFPLVYAPPFAIVAVILVPLVIANMLPAGPAQVAIRISPARALHTE
jgi:hypothetical protein